METTHELIEHQTISTIVENVEQAKADIVAAFDLLRGAKARLHAVLGHDSYYDSIIPSGARFSDVGLESGAKESADLITKNAWRYILAQTGLNHYMTEKRQKELTEQIDKGGLPPLTVENIIGTLQGLAGRIDGLLMESVKEIFDWLRPRNNWGVGTLKTNEKFKIGPKVIVQGMQMNYAGGFRISYHYEASFRALGNVFSLLDGKGVLKYPVDFITKINEVLGKARSGEKLETEYFEIKCYRNGRAHIKFKRLDLVKKLNQMASDDELPGTNGKGTS